MPAQLAFTDDIAEPETSSADLAPDRQRGEPQFSGPVTIAIWLSLIGLSWLAMALTIAMLTAGIEMVLKALGY